MSAKAPPIPPANRTDKGRKRTDPGRHAPDVQDPPENPDQQGQTAASKQNTTHQGYQQDR